jgi:hypothetical protein
MKITERWGISCSKTPSKREFSQEIVKVLSAHISKFVKEINV